MHLKILRKIKKASDSGLPHILPSSAIDLKNSEVKNKPIIINKTTPSIRIPRPWPNALKSPIKYPPVSKLKQPRKLFKVFISNLKLLKIKLNLNS